MRRRFVHLWAEDGITHDHPKVLTQVQLTFDEMGTLLGMADGAHLTSFHYENTELTLTFDEQRGSLDSSFPQVAGPAPWHVPDPGHT